MAKKFPNNRGLKEYEAWRSMRMRCLSVGNKRYAQYGGRGIGICSEWNSFDRFLLDMGYSPTKGHSLGRINNDGNYGPDNCRWETRQEQDNNKKTSRFVVVFGQKKTVTQWAAERGISRVTVYSRLNKLGWEQSRAVVAPPKKQGGCVA